MNRLTLLLIWELWAGMPIIFATPPDTTLVYHLVYFEHTEGLTNNLAYGLCDAIDDAKKTDSSSWQSKHFMIYIAAPDTEAYAPLTQLRDITGDSCEWVVPLLGNRQQRPLYFEANQARNLRKFLYPELGAFIATYKALYPQKRIHVVLDVQVFLSDPGAFALNDIRKPVFEMLYSCTEFFGVEIVISRLDYADENGKSGIDFRTHIGARDLKEMFSGKTTFTFKPVSFKK